jgi:predicted NUDIX family phosphoesterase
MVPGGTGFTGIRQLDASGESAIRDAIARHGRWMNRDEAEADPSHKQAIPYVIARDRSGLEERVYLMERTAAGGDPRLHHRATIGIGGHVNPVDDSGDRLEAGLRREWAEEMVAEWEPSFVAIGLLNDDRNPVGSVHLGVVFEVETAGRRLTVREQDKLSGRMVEVAEVQSAWDRLESWSQLVAAALWGHRAP